MKALSSRELSVKAFLDDAVERYHRPEFLVTDPLQVAHRYGAPEDQEVVGLLAAAFASGNIRAILSVLEKILAVLGEHPAEWLRRRRPEEVRGAFPGIYHRWVRESDLEVLLALIGETLRRHGTLGALWRSLDDPRCATTWPTLARFVDAILEMPIEPLARRGRELRRADGSVSPLASVESVLLTSPERGSACKRMNLFLRWMVRPADGIDLGLWGSFVSPARLLMPVDVHVMRQSQLLGLTRRKQPDQRAVMEITAKLRRFCPEDPCRYDFALVRVGIERKAKGHRGEG